VNTVVKLDTEQQAIKALEDAFELLKTKNPGTQEKLETAFKLGHFIGVVGDFGLTHGLDKEIPEFLEMKNLYESS